MSYSYVNGDGVSALDTATPDGATEPIDVVDQAIRQIKLYLADPVEGPEAKIQALSSPVKVVVTNSGTNQQIDETDGEVNLVFDNEDLDADNNFSTVNYKFTAPESGLYLCVVAAGFGLISSSTPTDIVHQLDIYVDGTSGAMTQVRRGTDDEAVYMNITRLFDLSAGQTLQARYTLTTASGNITMQLQADPRYSVFQVTRIPTL